MMKNDGLTGRGMSEDAMWDDEIQMAEDAARRESLCSIPPDGRREDARRATEARLVIDASEAPVGGWDDECNSEYAETVVGLSEPPVTDDIVRRLVAHHDWTPEGAAALTDLALRYGRWMLQHAANLAEALDIEDGSDGF